MFRGRLYPLLVALSFLLVSCSSHNTLGPTPDGTATIAVSVNVSGTLVATVVVDVTAPDIPTMLVFNIPVANGLATGTITVPAGSNRAILLRGYDAGGVETHNGSVTVNIQPGTNPTMAIVLTPLTGDVPITATLGSFIVTVTPPSVNLAIAGTAPLTATIKDAKGNPATGVVAWATGDPGVAVVDATGIVTATGAGTTTISAVFHGVTGTAAITVTP
jgi:hypothetical protein